MYAIITPDLISNQEEKSHLAIYSWNPSIIYLIMTLSSKAVNGGSEGAERPLAMVRHPPVRSHSCQDVAQLIMSQNAGFSVGVYGVQISCSCSC